MVEILIITPPHSIKPANKIIRDKNNKKHPNKDPLNNQEQTNNESDAFTESPLPYIDEIV